MSPSAKKKGMYIFFVVMLLLSCVGIYGGAVLRLFGNYDIMLKDYVKMDDALSSHESEIELLKQAKQFHSVFPNDYSQAILYSVELTTHKKINEQVFTEFMKDDDNKYVVVHEYCLLKLNVFNGPVDENMNQYLPEEPKNGCEADINEAKKQLQAEKSV
jgi:hypothetical protein